MTKPTNSADVTSTPFFKRWTGWVTTATALLGLVAAIFAIDGRYVKSHELDLVKTAIISDMRNQISINRSAMINNMQRLADDLEFEMDTARQNNKPVLRFQIDKHRQILRDIEELKNAE